MESLVDHEVLRPQPLPGQAEGLGERRGVAVARKHGVVHEELPLLARLAPRCELLRQRLCVGAGCVCVCVRLRVVFVCRSASPTPTPVPPGPLTSSMSRIAFSVAAFSMSMHPSSRLSVAQAWMAASTMAASADAMPAC